MSANSPRHVMRCVPVVVPPQAVNDRSIYDSVAGFIDVALANTPQSDPKDAILWTKFESTADISDLCYGDDWDLEGRAPPILLLILGYVTGIQIWAIPANGEAFEVLSWRHGSVKSLRILPTPQPCDSELADEPMDQFAHKRPLMAICDNSSSGGSGVLYCSLNFISLKSKEQVKTIKFKNPIIDILANRTSIAVTFPEKVAVFDAKTLEDRLTITACHPSPGLNPNPIALAPRWMAYAERRLLPSKRSSGGCDYDGVSSYTATVLNAAKSLGKGLRDLGETVAAGFVTHGSQTFPSNLSSGSQSTCEKRQPGVITILDIKYPINDASPVSGAPVSSNGDDRIIAHFIAHSDAVVAMTFDCSGMLLITANKRGHDFHVFRIHAHPGGPSMSAVHHLYVLHRGDTTAKVQDICVSLDSRWVAVSTLRGTTHVFPITPYGGPAGVRTHGSSHVVNRLSRFHRSAGLSIDSRSSSPISHSDYSLIPSLAAYPNPRTPPFPHPTVVVPLAQLRQPLALGPGGTSGSGFTKGGQGRQRVTSLSEDSSKPLRMSATFARPRAWLLETGTPRDSASAKMQNKTSDSLFVATAFGTLVQYDLDPKPVTNIPKEKVCDDTPIQLDMEAKAQWNLLRHDDSIEIQPPLPPDNILLKERLNDGLGYSDDRVERHDERDDVWLAQVEIITHAGPHRRLWMGPQFMFKTYNTPSGCSLSTIEAESIEIGVGSPGNRPARSNPVNMPSTTSTTKPAVSVLIESSSYSSIEQSPRMTQLYHGQSDSNFSIGSGENQLREDLADAMREAPGVPLIDAGSVKKSTGPGGQLTSLPSSNIVRNNVIGSIAKVVNPLGTVTTIVKTDHIDERDEFHLPGGYISDHYVHENCDEALFRPVVTVISGKSNSNDNIEKQFDRPAPMGLDLIVPVIEEKPGKTIKNQQNIKPKIENNETKVARDRLEEIQKFEELSAQNKKRNLSIKPKTQVTEITKTDENPKSKSGLGTKDLKSSPITTITEPTPDCLNKSSKYSPPAFSQNDDISASFTGTIPSLATSKSKKKLQKQNKNNGKKNGGVVEKPSEENILPVEKPNPLTPHNDIYEIIELEKKEILQKEVANIQVYAGLFEVADHFSIQESLIKNSNYVLKSSKPTQIETKQFHYDEEEILNFDMVTIDDDHLEEKNWKSVTENHTDPYSYSNRNLHLSFMDEFMEPLPPLEPFIDNFDGVTYSEASSELMNFESPQENFETNQTEISYVSDTNKSKANDEFSIYNFLNDVEYDDYEKNNLTEITTIEKSENNSSDDTEKSITDKKEDDSQKIDEDDELEPLISTATTSSDTTPSCSKVIVDSLPENITKIPNMKRKKVVNRRNR